MKIDLHTLRHFLDQSSKTTILISIAVVAACYSLCICLTPMFFLTVEDTNIQNCLSGNYSGSPFPVFPYVNVLVTYPISWLYAAVPTFPWWYAYSHLLLAIGLVLINYSLFTYARQGFIKVLATSLLGLTLDVGLLIRTISAVCFTVVPAVLVTGLIGVLLTTTRKLRTWELVCASVLLALALCHRNSTWLACTPFILIAIVCHFYLRGFRRYQLLSRFCICLAAISMLFLSVNGIDERVQGSVNGDEYVRLKTARTDYIDYPHDTYDQNPRLYEANGWSRTVYSLTENWCFMDEAVSTDAFVNIVEHSEIKAKTTSRAALLNRWNALMGDKEIRLMVILFVLVAVTAVALSATSGNKGALLLTVASSVSSILLIGCQLYIGRALYRTVAIVFIPAVTINTIGILSCIGNVRSAGPKRVLTASLVMLMAVTFQAGYIALSPTNQPSLDDSITARAVCDYATAHPKYIYVKSIDVTMGLDPCLLYDDKKPSNLLYWQIPCAPPAYTRAQLLSNGLERLDGKTMLMENARFLSATNLEDVSADASTPGKLFYSWLREKYGVSGYKLQDVIHGEVYVYRFLR